MNGCHSSNNTEIKQVVIQYVNRNVEPIYSVSCDNFEQFFGENNFKKKIITGNSQLKKFIDCLNDYQSASLNNIDVRAKIYIYYFNKTKSVLCVDKFGNTMVNGNYMGANKKLITFLEDSCEGFK